MQVSELFELTKWIDEKIKAPAILQNYQNLHQKLNGNTQGRQQQPFQVQKDKVIESIESVDYTGLTHSQEEMLDSMGILDCIGKRGVTNLEDILFRNNLDISTASSEVQKVYSRLNQAIQSSDAFQQHLSRYLPTESDIDDELDRNEVLIRVHFQRDVSLDNVAKFEEFGKKWHEIGRGIAMAHNMTPEDVKIVGAAKGSVIIELGVIAGIALTASKVLVGALQLVEKSIGIKKALGELRLLELNITKAEMEIEKQAREIQKAGITALLEEVTADLNLRNENGEGDKIKALEKAIKGLVEFVENGGEIDFYSPEKEEAGEEINQLKAKFEEIRKIEKRLLAIESKDN